MVTLVEKTEDLRVRRTRKLLMDAFTELVLTKGFQTLTVQQIADRAMVHRATFYDHFVDKYALFEYVIREQFQQTLYQTVPEDFSYTSDHLALLVSTTCAFLRLIAASCLPKDHQTLAMVQTHITLQIVEILAGWLETAWAERTVSHPPAELAATVTAWAIYGAGLYWSKQADEELATFVDQVLPSIAASFREALAMTTPA
jgi:AcrR family transcriptional regulator